MASIHTKIPWTVERPADVGMAQLPETARIIMQGPRAVACFRDREEAMLAALAPQMRVLLMQATQLLPPQKELQQTDHLMSQWLADVWRLIRPIYDLNNLPIHDE